MKKQTSSRNNYQTTATNGRFPSPIPKQKTTWMRFLLFCLFGWRDTAVPQLQPIRIQNRYQRNAHNAPR